MVAVFMPGTKSTPSACVPDHQFQAVFPGLIQDVSAMAEGGFRLPTMFDSISLPGSDPISSTRQGQLMGAEVCTASVVSSLRGARVEIMVRPSSCCKYIPAKLSISASVTATQPTPGCSTRNGRAINES